MTVRRDLVFDFGLFDGADTRFYLAKGFSVVALEARSDLVQAAQAQFADSIRSGQLTIVNRALWSEADQQIPFYVRSGWSSLYRDSAERDGNPSATITEVMTTTIAELFARFGVPHYLKVDIEGADAIALEQLSKQLAKPSFVSIEDPDGSLIPLLIASGYDRFQFSNQGLLPHGKTQRRSREGRPAIFSGNCSGRFGHDLPRSRWVGAGRLTEQIAAWHAIKDRRFVSLKTYALRKWGKMTNRGWLYSGGWLDIHATRTVTLQGQTSFMT